VKALIAFSSTVASTASTRSRARSNGLRRNMAWTSGGN